MKFTKIAALVLSLGLVVSGIAACSNEPEPVSSDINIISTQGQGQGQNNNSSGTINQNAASENYILNYKGVDLIVDTEFDESKFNDSDYEYREDTSCASNEMTSYYFFGNSLYVETYPGSSIIYHMVISDDTITIPEGVYIGQSKDDVKAACGEPNDEATDYLFSYIKGTSNLKIGFNAEGKVNNISYVSTSLNR